MAYLAAVLIPHLPCVAEILSDPALAGRPLVVGDAGQARSVLDCSPEALAAGVRPGMLIRQAMSRCPEAAFLPPDPTRYRDLWEAVLSALDEISPEVEDARLGRSYVNLAGLDLRYPDHLALGEAILAAVRGSLSAAGAADSPSADRARDLYSLPRSPDTAPSPHLGIADAKFTAFAAAVVGAGGEVTVVPRGRGTAFLAPLDVSVLPVSAEALARLALLGIESIGEVAAIPRGALEAQFGREGRRLWELCNGEDPEPLRPRRRVEVLEERLSFEAPVAGIDVILAGARQLLSRLRLPLRGRAARELLLRAELAGGRSWEKRVVFREAVSEEARLEFILRSALAAAPPPEPVRGLSLRLAGLAGETGKQLSFGDKSRLQRQVEEAVRQLKARYGFSPVYRCVDVEPWSVVPEERQVLVESDA